MKDIVYLTTSDISKAKPITDSKVIADTFGKRHTHLIRKIEEIVKSDESEHFSQPKMGSANYVDAQGKYRKLYKLTEAQTMYLIMGFTGKKAGEFKDAFINQFQMMRHELMARSETRSIGKVMRASMIDSIGANLEDGTNHKKYAYSNYSKLVYKKVLGTTVKKLKDARGLKPADNLRDHLTIGELNKVQDVESRIAVMIDTMTALGIDDKGIYEKVKEIL